MGYYIQVPWPTGKARQLAELYGAEVLPCKPAWGEVPEGMAVICVVDNGPFEAAALCYSEQEFDDFAESINDRRLRTWVLMNKGLAYDLAGYD